MARRDYAARGHDFCDAFRVVAPVNGSNQSPLSIWTAVVAAFKRRLPPNANLLPDTWSKGADQSGTTWFHSPWSRYLGGRGSLRGLAGRALALLTVLSVAKAGVVVALERLLFQTHWRLQLEHVTVFDRVNFLFFVGLVAASLVELGR